MPTLGYDSKMILDAYVAPLRSALMIDDKFPTYEDMLDYQRLRDAGQNAKPSSYDYDNLSKLLAECRQRHLLCDVQSKVDQLTEAQLEHLGKSDLVVLDYHLDSHADTDPEKAISVLQRLAQSPHANLVVVYTLDTPLDRVRRTVACRFRGATQLQERPRLSEDQEEFLQMWRPEPSSADLDAYLRGDSKTLLKSNLTNELNEQKIPMKDIVRIVPEVIEEHLREHYLPGNATPAANPNQVEMNATDSRHHWLSFGNVFVVFVAKNQDVSIFEELEAALWEWQPLPMKMMLAHIRNQFETGGFRFEKEILADSEKLTGWFFHALTGEEPELNQRLKQLWARLLDGLRGQLTQSVTEFGERVLGPSITNLGEQGHDSDSVWLTKCLGLARLLAGADKGADDPRIVHALNSFLCSEEYDGSHIRTGTVCRIVTDASAEDTTENWFLCASPACEMVPRPPGGTGAWTHDLDPFMAVTVLRLAPLKHFRTPLKKATNGKHIFLIIGGEPMSFEVVDAEKGHPRPEVIFVANRGVTSADACIDAFFIKKRTTPSLAAEIPATLQQATPISVSAELTATIPISTINLGPPFQTSTGSADPAVLPSTALAVEPKESMSSTIAVEPTNQASIPEPALPDLIGPTSQNENSEPLTITSVKLQAVAQLRSSYADRFLHQLGHHSSRIGVDFVNSF